MATKMVLAVTGCQNVPETVPTMRKASNRDTFAISTWMRLEVYSGSKRTLMPAALPTVE